MSDLRELYQEVILDHTKRPRNFGKLERTSHRAEGFNPICGDAVCINLDVEDGVVKAVSFEGHGCAISTASASLMTEAVKGRSAEEVERLFEKFHALVTSSLQSEAEVGNLGKLRVFAGVREFPMRVKCATLSWHTLRAALSESHATVTTE